MRSNFSYWFTDFAVKVLTFDSLIFKRLINKFKVKKGHVLDIGCGTGTQAPLFRKSQYMGIDIDPGVINYAKTHYPGYKFAVGDATNFKLKKKYDLILVVGVLHHLSDKQAIRSLERVRFHLKPGGKVLIIEAIPPLLRWNLIGVFLRSRDRGANIRALGVYKKLVQKHFKIELAKNIYGGFFDYAFIVSYRNSH